MLGTGLASTEKIHAKKHVSNNHANTGHCSGLGSGPDECISVYPPCNQCSNAFFLPCMSAEYQTSVQEKLPLIIGSSAAGLVFLVAVVIIIIVCNR